jgi:hypothetical protein
MMTWSDGEKSRPLQLVRVCPCGCDTRDGDHVGAAGYLTASDDTGQGFTIWIEEEDIFQVIKSAIESETSCEQYK